MISYTRNVLYALDTRGGAAIHESGTLRVKLNTNRIKRDDKF